MAHLVIDAKEVHLLAIDLRKAPSRMQKAAPKVFARGAYQIHRGLRRDASGHRYLKHLASTVAHDRQGELHYEIGFNKIGQGKLANIIVFGSINNAPVFDLMASTRRELPALLFHLGEAAEDAVLTEDAR